MIILLYHVLRKIKKIKKIFLHYVQNIKKKNHPLRNLLLMRSKPTAMRKDIL